jgi:hypothetical protein
MLRISDGMTVGYGYFWIYQNTIVGRIAHQGITSPSPAIVSDEVFLVSEENEYHELEWTGRVIGENTGKITIIQGEYNDII